MKAKTTLRAQLVTEAMREGKTFREAGQIVGVSVERARQMDLQYQRYEKRVRREQILVCGLGGIEDIVKEFIAGIEKADALHGHRRFVYADLSKHLSEARVALQKAHAMLDPNGQPASKLGHAVYLIASARFDLEQDLT